MADQTKTTGTPDQDGGDALEQTGTAGTPEADDRDAESGDGQDINYWKDQALRNKEAAEERNRLKSELEELKESSSQPPAAESVEVQEKTDELADLLAQAEAAKARSQVFLRNGDPVAARAEAALAIAQRAEARQIQSDINRVLERQYDNLPKETRDQAVKLYNKRRDLYGDLNVAHSDIESKTLKTQLADANKRLAALEREPDPEVVKAPPTHGREIGARETKQRNQTQTQWDSQMAALDAKIDEGDFAARDQKYALQHQRRTGKIKVGG